MVKLWFALFIIALLPLQGSAQSQVFDGKYSLQSHILNEERSYWVHVPSSYDSEDYAEKKYPVAYILDGEMQFIPFVGVMNSMSSGANGNYRIPELIVVGIVNEDRFRDFTPTRDTTADEGSEFFTSGGGTEFLDFIKRELIPDVESKYRGANHRLLVGHSLGGLFAVQSLIEEPDLFQAYAIIDPSLWWDDGLLLDRTEEQIEPVDVTNTSVYLATPEYTDENYQVTSTSSLMTNLQSKGIQASYERIPDVTHGSVPLFGFYNALPFIYGDLQLSIDSIVESGTSYITSHYDQLSERLGFEYLPPERLVETIGQYTSSQPDVSLAFFRLNTNLYPESVNAHRNLGEAYEAQGQLELAIESYQRAQELAPESIAFDDAIESLRDRVD